MNDFFHYNTDLAEFYQGYIGYTLQPLSANPFEILRGGGLETKNKNVWVGVREKNKMHGGALARKIKYVGGVGEKNEMWGRGSVKFSSPPPRP